MTVRIVTDSTCDIPQELAEKWRIEVAPAYVNIGEQSLTDGIQLTHDSFYANIGNYAHHPTTAACAPGTFTEAFEKMAAEGATDVVVVTVSSDLSAFFTAAKLGAQATDAVNIHLVDSRNVSLGLGLLVLSAAKAAANGDSAETIVARLHSQIPRTVVFATADTLEFLRKSGRVGFATAGIGSLLKIKPILRVKDGVAVSFDRVRTRKKILPKLAELVASLGELEDLAVVHSNASERAAALKGAIQARFPADSDEIVSSIGPAIGCHVGPGALGVACIAKA